MAIPPAQRQGGAGLRDRHSRRVHRGSATGTVHTLRHTHITIALTEGVPVHVVAARAGDPPEQVLSTYSHLLPHSDAAAATAVAAAIAPEGSLTSG